MKIRNGFVSNSSSSSFLVAFDRIPKTVEDLKTMMFPNGEKFVDSYSESMSTLEVATRVFSDMQKSEWRNNGPFPFEIALIKVNKGDGYVSDGMVAIHNEIIELVEGQLREDIDTESYTVKMQDLLKKKRELMLSELLESERELYDQIKDKKIFVFKYSGEGGDGVLEHDNIFRNLLHIRISHH